ncbi:hypothetical protein [Thermococcus sp.]|uniref:hypothetical protein n=1 Tax=Thermococcus sp. TaxID=35749 RepID=UPI00261EDC92|nr:hypothetical protein [Thermococcus sp.]
MNAKTKVKTKAVLSSILIAVYIGAVFLTIGEVMAVKQGSFLGMRGLELLKLKSKYGLIMLSLIAIHLGLNWDMFKNEVKVLRS